MFENRIFPIQCRAMTARPRLSVRAVLTCVIFVVSISVGIRLRQFTVSPIIRPAGFPQPLLLTGSSNGEAGSRSEGVKFIFIMGLEGSGHHRVGSLVRKSRSAGLVDALGLREKVRDLQDALYSSVGLLYLHCNQTGYKSEILTEGPTPRRAPSMNSVSLERLGANETFHRVINIFRSIVDEIGSGTSINIPLNADGYISNQASYPQDYDSCRLRKYPDLALLYEACQAANAECLHAYLTASVETLLHAATPIAPVTTKTKRTPLPKKRLTNIFLYTTLLDVQLAQIAYFPDRTVACLDLSSDDSDPNDTDVPSQGWQRAISRMFGLSASASGGAADGATPANALGFERGDETMGKKSNVKFGSQGELHDEDLYLEVFRKSHERTLAFCLANVPNVHRTLT
jgi:hypothetical protein